jgi:acetyl-CoA carboxylase biotin carboxyl carrier protein
MADSKATNDNKNNRGSAPGMNVDTKLIRQLADMLADTGLTEIEVEDGDRRIRVAKSAYPAIGGLEATAPVAIAAPATAPASAPAAAPAADAAAAVPANALRSPMVGTAYLSGEPGPIRSSRSATRSRPGRRC